MSDPRPTATTAGARARIIDGARRLFATRGYGSTSIKAIAEEAGVSQGLMYAYFGSKDDLLRAIFEEGLQDVWSTMPVASGDPMGDIEVLLRRSFEIVAEHESLWRLIYALRVQPDVVERLAIDLNAWGSAIESKLRDLCSEAGMRDPSIEAKLLFAIIDGANQHRTLSREPYPVDALTEAVMAKFRGEEPT